MTRRSWRTIWITAGAAMASLALALMFLFEGHPLTAAVWGAVTLLWALSAVARWRKARRAEGP
jgi:hypothetical protein